MRLHALVLMLCLRFSRRAAASPTLGGDADGCPLKISSFAAQAELALTLLAKCSELFLLHAANCVDGVRSLLCETKDGSVRDCKEQSTFCKKLCMRSAAGRAKIVVRTHGVGRCVSASILESHRRLFTLTAKPRTQVGSRNS